MVAQLWSAGQKYGKVKEKAVRPPEDAHEEREHRHQQHAHVLAASLQPTLPETLILSPTPAKVLPPALTKHLGAFVSR